MNFGNGQLLQALAARRGMGGGMGGGMGQPPGGTPAAAPGGQMPAGNGGLLKALMDRMSGAGRFYNVKRPQPQQPQQMAPIAPKPMEEPRDFGGMGPAGY